MDVVSKEAYKRVLGTPYFAAKTHALRMILLQESPSAFRERNIFVSDNSLNTMEDNSFSA